ncbi:HLA class II histocompatibility antigen [Prionailurus iriomotensis]
MAGSQQSLQMHLEDIRCQTQVMILRVISLDALLSPHGNGAIKV